MINAKTELQYQIALDILMRMKAARIVTEDEAESIRRLAMEKYRPITVRESYWLLSGGCGSVVAAKE